MRSFQPRQLLGSNGHVALIALFAIAAFYGIYWAVAVALWVGGIPVAIGSVMTIAPLFYCPLHAAIGGDWWPSILLYGGWLAVMLSWALYERTLVVNVAAIVRPRKPR